MSLQKHGSNKDESQIDNRVPTQAGRDNEWKGHIASNYYNSCVGRKLYIKSLLTELYIWRTVKYGPTLIDTILSHSSHSDKEKMKSVEYQCSYETQQEGFMLMSE